MKKLFHDYPCLQRQIPSSLNKLSKRALILVPGFMGKDEMEAEKVRRVRALAEKMTPIHTCIYYILASRLLSCNNYKPCYLAICPVCGGVAQLNDMRKYMGLFERDKGYIAISIDMNKNISKITKGIDSFPYIINNIKNRIDQLFKSMDFDGVIAGRIVMEHHSFEMASEGDYCVPQIRLLIKDNDSVMKRMESYLMRSGNMYVRDSILNTPLRKYSFENPEEILAYVFDRSWYERPCTVTSEKILMKGEACQLSGGDFADYLVRQRNYISNYVRLHYYKVNTK